MELKTKPAAPPAAEADPSEEGLESYHAKSHFWGRLTLGLCIVASLLPPLYLSYVLGYHPGWGVVAGGFLGYAAFIGIMWVLEPVTYYPTLGISGTYIAFLTGNIANMCLPCSASAQEAIRAEPGTRKAEIAGTLGIAAASLTNIVLIIGVILSGSYLLTLLPQPVQAALKFILPAIYGGVLGQFAMKKPLYGLVALTLGMLILFSPVMPLLKIVLCVFSTVGVCLYLERLKRGRPQP
jgi:hypothetical protein